MDLDLDFHDIQDFVFTFKKTIRDLPEELQNEIVRFHSIFIYELQILHRDRISYSFHKSYEDAVRSWDRKPYGFAYEIYVRMIRLI